MASETTDITTEQNGASNTVEKGKGKAVAPAEPEPKAAKDVEEHDDDDEGEEAEDADMDEDELADLHEDAGESILSAPSVRRTRSAINYASEEAAKAAGVKPDHEDEDEDEEDFKDHSMDADD